MNYRNRERFTGRESVGKIRERREKAVPASIRAMVRRSQRSMDPEIDFIRLGSAPKARARERQTAPLFAIC